MGSVSTGSDSVRKYARHSAAQWRVLISEFEASGVSQQDVLHPPRPGEEHLRAVAAQATRGPNTDVAGVRPEALFVELTAPVVDKTEVLPATPAWEVELDLGAGVVLRLRRGAPC
jgi:hypothetical protein